jgi:hypothetical protein
MKLQTLKVLMIEDFEISNNSDDQIKYKRQSMAYLNFIDK